MTDEELDLVETDSLIAAISRRSSAYVLGILQDRSEQEEGTTYCFAGGRARCVGLAELLKHKLIEEFAVREDDPDD